MDHKNYKHAFQQIRFSEHLEEDILSNLEKLVLNYFHVLFLQVLLPYVHLY